MTRLDALAGLAVLELSAGQNYAVPYATKLLADLGADVTVAEPPGGHPLRRGHPGQPDNPVVDAAVYGFLSMGKTCVPVADPADFGAGQLAALIGAADIVVATGPAHDGPAHDGAPVGAGGNGALPGDLPPAVSRLLATPAPGIARAVVTVSPWGSGGGPYAGLPVTPITLQAAAGWITSRKEVDMWPVQVGGQLDEWASGAFVATAALTAFRQAQQTGTQVSADLSLLECAHSFLCYDNLRYDARGELGVSRDRILVAPFGIRRCKDGWVGINTLTHQQWKDACELTGLTQYTGDQQALNRGEGDLDAFAARLTEFLSEMTVDEVVELAQARRIPAAPVAAGTQMCGLRQWTARPFFVEIDQDGRRLRVPGAPFRLYPAPGTPAASPNSGSSRPKAPTAAANRTNDLSEPAGAPAERAGAPAGLPFSGLRVVDLSHFWSGPYLTMFLGAYGADVIKIESVQRPDLWRANHTGPALGDRWHDRGVMWQATNLDKRDVTLDLGSDAGRELLLRLVATADVFVENFAVRVLDKLGLAYDVLREINPRLIMLRLPGFGLDGPWRDYVGFGDSFEQIGGLATVTGYPDGRPQTPGGYLDPMVGMHAGAALLAALRQRDLTGLGQLIEVPQIEVAASMAAPQLIGDELGVPPTRIGNRGPRYAPQGVYRCGDTAPDDTMPEYVALSVRDDDEWARLVRLLGRPEPLVDPALSSLAGRQAAHELIDAVLQDWASARPVTEAVAAIQGAGVPAARLLRPARFNADPQLTAAKYYQEVTHPLSGPRLYPVFPMVFSFETAERKPHWGSAPLLGQHNHDVLAGELGLAADELAALEKSRVIGVEPLPRSGLI